MASQFPRGDLFKIPFSQMALREGNKREDYGDIDIIVSSMLANIEAGKDPVVTPLKGYLKKDTFYIVRGHRRYEAMRIIYEKHGIDIVAPATTEAKGTSEEDRLIEQITTNNYGKEFTPLEQASVLEELFTYYGYNGAAAAKRLGVTEAWVSKLKLLIKAPESIRDLLRRGVINANFAMEVVRLNKVDELLKQVEEGDDLQQDITAADGTTITAPKVKKLKEPGGEEPVNSWKAFKNVASFIDNKKLDKDKKVAFDLLVAFLNNEMDEEQIKRYFYPESDLEGFGE